MQGPTPLPKINGRLSRGLAAAALILIAVSFAFRARLVFTRYFDPDEMEHLHAALSVRRGMVPARDFFQHHPPLYYYLLAPLGFLEPEIPVLFLARGVSQVFTLLVLFSTYRLGKRCFGREAGALGAAMLAFNFVFLWRTIEIRPDIPAAALLLEGIIRLWDGWRDGSARRWLGAGLLFGTAFLFTQKVVYPLLGTGAAVVLWLLSPPPGIGFRDRRRALILLVAGGLLPIAALALFFHLQGGLIDLVRTNILLPLRWRRKVWPWHLRTLVFYNPFFTAAGGMGILYRLRTAFKSRPEGYREFLPVLTVSAGIAGSWLVPIAQPQYFLSFLPLAAVFSGFAFLAFAQWATRTGPAGKSAAYLLFIAVGAGIPVIFKTLFNYRLGINLGDFWTGVVISILAAVIAFAALLKPKIVKPQTAVLLLAAAVLVRPAWTFAHYHLLHNRDQLKAIDYLHRITAPDDRVMDGWTGISVFRPHAYYYYFLHEGMLKMLSEEDKGERLLAALKENPPKVIINDVYLNSVGEEVREFIARRYRASWPIHHYFLMPYRESERHFFPLPEEKGEIRYHIERLDTADDAIVELRGWAFIPGESATDRETFIALESKEGVYIFDAQDLPRPDVTDAYGNSRLNLDMSGFLAFLPTATLPKGSYRIGIYIRKPDGEALVYTTRELASPEFNHPLHPVKRSGDAGL